MSEVLKKLRGVGIGNGNESSSGGEGESSFEAHLHILARVNADRFSLHLKGPTQIAEIPPTLSEGPISGHTEIYTRVSLLPTRRTER